MRRTIQKHIHSHVHGNDKLTKLTIPNQVQQETSYKLAAEKATALSWSDPNLMRINPHQTMTIKKKHIAAVQFNKNLKAVHATSSVHVLEQQQCTHPVLPSWS